MDTSSFFVLAVCRANVCRSPLIADRVREEASRGGLASVIQVDSAGTDAALGARRCASAQQWAGSTLAGSPAQVDSAMLARADVILAADREVAGECAALAPSCRPRLFTVGQAAFLARVAASEQDADGRDTEQSEPATPPVQLRRLVEWMDGHRYRLAGMTEGADVIVDRHGPEPHEEVFAEIDEVAIELGEALVQFARSNPI